MLCASINQIFAQATKSYPFAIGTTNNCGGGGTQEVHFYDYNGTSNILTNITSTTGSNPVARFTPQLRIGTSSSSGQRYTPVYASISFNPKDHNVYYFWTSLSSINGATTPRTYVWRWPVGTKPTSTSPRLDTLCSFQADLLGVVFDNNGNAYTLDFDYSVPPNTPQTVFIRSVDFINRSLGGKDYLSFTGGAIVYQYGSGDIALTPSGQMLFVLDNKFFTLDYKSYTGTGINLTATYVDTVKVPSGNFVGLTYAEGETVAAFSGGTCPFNEINPLTAVLTGITKSGGTSYNAWDMASIVSGIGAAKKLVSVTPTGTPNQYTVVYDVFVKNYGNMDVTNVQVTDDLKAINGNSNVAFVSANFVSNPAGMVLNPAYDGITNINLLNGSGTLPNYPVANNNFTIRITCVLSNIMAGTVYNNSAYATAKDFNNNTLTDKSTNGSNPDLNSNDKPDDAGEDEPTPLLIAVTPTIAPCNTLGQVIYLQDFGSGTGRVTTFPMATGGTATPTTQYAGTTTAPVPVEKYTISNNAVNGDASKWISLTDHTGNSNGRMMLVNADAQHYIIYKDESPIACANQQYSFFFYGAFIGNSSYQTICNGFGGFKYPKVTLRVRDKTTGSIIAQATTDDITSTTWQQYGMKFTMPAGFSNVILELVNEGEGGCGNDLAIDDIQFGLCDPSPIVSIGATAAGCIGSAAVFNSTISDPTALNGTPQYQWQVSTDNITFTNITGATNAVYTIANTTSGDVGKYYRVIVAGPGNLASTTCRYVSPGVILPAKTQSTAPTKANASLSKICPGKVVTLSITGGTLGSGATWKWYSGSCGGTAVGTGATINVSPSVTTTYYVRAEGDCNITICRAVTVTITCDIDKDKDGIPDWVESNMPAAFADHDGDGIVNAFDTDYPGFIDNNGDFINDWFQADGDVDGDGIPNYLDTDFPGRIDVNGDGVDDRFDNDLDGIINMLDLDSDNDGIPDVVEAGGVDANGDGKIDNFTDSDGDGLSDQVDKNLSGAYNSGTGLGLKDTDGDGVPNQFDLDSDNDGIPDVVEVGGSDANNDGKIDGFVDANNDGIADHIVGVNALLKTGADVNNDGKADSYPFKNMDKDGVPNPYDLDSDGDGIVDVLEADLPDADYNGIVDGTIGSNGWSTTVSSKPTLILPNSDGDPNPDYLDIDSDNDGITDNIEGPSTFDYKLPLGIDTDNDGIDDAYDNKKTQYGGHGIYIADTDADGIPDFRDLDTDGDGYPDIVEGHDYNFNAIFDETTTLTGIDTDGDGLDDRFDLDNTSAKGTSSNLGNNGTFSGDPSPGTTAVVQRTPPAAPNRDWRWLPFVLPVNFVQFNAQPANGQVSIKWEINDADNVKRFDVFKSSDNRNFYKIGEVSPSSKLTAYHYADQTIDYSNNTVFYRVHAITNTGTTVMTNVAAVQLNNNQVQLVVKPNPATNSTMVSFHSAKESNATIEILSNTGKVVMTLKQKIYRGNNSILLNNLSMFSNGVYNIQIITDEEWYHTKLVILK